MKGTRNPDLEIPLPEASAEHGHRPYPSYRSTEGFWIPEIPEGWDFKRLRYVVTFPTKAEARNMQPDEIVSFIPMEAVGEYGGLVLDETRPLTEVMNGYTYFRDEDVLVAKITPCFENGKGAVAGGLVGGVGFGTTELHVLRAGREILPDFLFYLTVSDDFRRLGTAEMYGAGGQKRVPEDFIKELRHPLPPLPEQRAIAAFLDRETARIDALVAKKERLIALLQEKRTALISHAVTKGLNPDVKMKDSGVEWLGEVPEHWEVDRLKHVMEFLNSRRVPLSGEVRATMAKVYPYYGASGIIDYVEDYIFDEPLILVAEDGANLYSRSTPLAFVATGEYWVNNHAHILHPRVGPISYWEAVLQTVEYDPWITGSAQPKLTKEHLGSIPLPFPPLEEQSTIAEVITAETTKMMPIMEAIRRGAERLREYRTALISAAVTGKIDVREEVPCA